MEAEVKRNNGIRHPAVAGAFYPADKAVLEQMVKEKLSFALPVEEYADILGIISPHAGYVYSGITAGYGYNVLKQKKFETAIIIAPSHRATGFVYSVGNYAAYNLPLGLVEVDQEAVSEIMTRYGLSFHQHADLYEHSLEVQLPFLKTIKPQAKILPVIFGYQSQENARKLAEILAELINKDLDKYALIISTDLSHFYPASVSDKMDGALADLVENGNYSEISEGIKDGRFEACGFGGIIMLLMIAEILGYKKIKNLHYSHSGQITGNNDQVVGYLSSVVYGR